MGKVTDELVDLITKQVDDRGIVVWYDPEQAYGEVVAGLALPDASVLRYSDGFFELRHRIDPMLEFVEEDGSLREGAEIPPRLVVYVPQDRSETQYALIEVESAGVVMEPGANPWQRNTRLKVLAERVFKRIAPDRAPEIARRVDEGTVNLAELDWLSDQSGELGAVKLVFGTTVAREVATMLACSDEYDGAIQEKQALAEVAELLRADLGVEISSEGAVAESRRGLCRSLLLGDLAARCEEAGYEIPELSTVDIPRTKGHRSEVTALCQAWRNRADLRDAYAAASRAVEEEANVPGLTMPAACLAEVETFATVEDRLLQHAESQLLDGAADEVLTLAQRRKQSFWATVELTRQLRWSLLETAAQLLLAATRVETELKSIAKRPPAMIGAYAEGEGVASGEPWCLLDTHHRHLERQYAAFELDIGGGHDGLQQVVIAARQRYAQVIGTCAEAMTEALTTTGFDLDGVAHQSEVFATHVSPVIHAAKTAYLLVDALRFEMARELLQGLGEEFEITLAPAAAQLPSVTEVGMSAVLPGAEKGMELVAAGAGKVAIKIGQSVLRDRAKRVEHLRSGIGGETADVKLNQLMKPTKKRREEIESAAFVLVTSQEIDRLGEETEDEEEARRYMDEVLDKLRRGMRMLRNLGVKQIIIAADHGHLFGEVVDSGLKVDPPGGETVDLHRRVWIGRGGMASDAFIRVPASQLGLGGDLELAFPRGLGCFVKSGPSRAFFHGGTSLQEMVVPVAVVKVTEEAAPEVAVPSVELMMDRAKITNRLFSVVAKYVGGTLFAAPQKRVKLLVRAGRKDVGAAAVAAYGFEDGTQEIVLEQGKPNAITVMLSGDVEAKAASILVVDAASQVELASLKNVPIDIAM